MKMNCYSVRYIVNSDVTYWESIFELSVLVFFIMRPSCRCRSYHHHYLRSCKVNLSPTPKRRKKLVTCTVQCVRTKKKYLAKNDVSNRRIDISVVDVASRQTDLTVRGSVSGSGKRLFSSPECHDGSGAHPAASSGYRRCIPGVEWLGSEADHLPPSNAVVKNRWIYTSAPRTYLGGADSTTLLAFSVPFPTSELRFSKRVLCVNSIYLTFVINVLSGIADCLVLNGSLTL